MFGYQKGMVLEVVEWSFVQYGWEDYANDYDEILQPEWVDSNFFILIIVSSVWYEYFTYI